ncbi:signal transduction histidine kinase (plasmid) [Synechococcus sp. PCC 7502]|uniref:GAF domain-containing protein n=1 Tax=Synechococcus sp. PCC 7502 TaxID=1173263 RepID=UPI00029FB471|nr:GAF domain-containing protein [Synechococcus sp. PCC 7502]AFY75480.1 signal transduction histidine kinase [Synechococcus sp. PCC 7502]
MEYPQIPTNENDRLAELNRYNILDTLPEQEYDDITNLASKVCGTPIALISFVDRDRQWFKSRVGLDETETPREISFCGHVVFDNEILNVPDATKDLRFADHPSVTESPNIRFYLGIPLKSPDNYTLGTLCVVDYQPRELTPEHISQLESLSRLVISQLELRRNEQTSRLLNSVVESSHDPIITKTLDGIVTSLNPAAVRVFGYSTDDIVGKSILLMIPPDRQEEETMIIARLRQGERIEHFETIRLCKDGSTRDVSLTISPLMDEKGKVIGISKILRDITEHKRWEEQKQRLTERLTLALESGAIGCWEWDISQNIIDCDDRMYEMYGISKETDSHQLFEILVNAIHHEDRSDTLTLLEQASLGLAEYDCEFRVIHPDRSIHFIKAYGKLVRDDQCNPKCMIGINFDISDRKEAEAKLSQLVTQKEALFFITQSILQVLDIPHILNITVNKIREILDLDRVAIYRFQPDWGGEFIVESVDDAWVKLIENGVHKTWDDTYLQETRGGRFRKHECMVVPDIYQADFSPCYLEILERMQVKAYMITPIFINETLWGLLGLYKNVQPYAWQSWQIELLEQTEKQVAIGIHQANLYEQVQSELAIRKQTEIQLLKVNDELLSATKLKDEFLANMSHELRTPLNSILGLSEGLHEQLLGTLNEKQLNAIGTVASSGEHLLSLINDILDLSKITSGMMKLDISPVSVKNLCNSSLAFIKQQAFNKRIQVSCNIPPHINKINVEERRMKQVLINLLTNAVKFTPNEGQIRLLVADGSGGTWQGEAIIPQRIRDINSPMIVFQVVDTGIGIAAKDLPRLFQPFVQVDSALNRQYEGTGLGLALVKQIVELHGGQIMAESEVGKGSRFTVALPYQRSESSAPESEPTVTTSPPLVVNPENAPLILLAEDNDVNIQTFTSYLTAINYRVIIAKNGEAAVSMAKANSADIILMDIQMPGMDGFEATKQIRLDPNLINTPIIAITALAMEGDRERCLAAGMNGYMSKPLKLKQLATQIDELLQIKP